MKRIHEMIRPFFTIIIGALLFLIYLNSLSAAGTALAMGIVGFIIAIIYIGVGIAIFVLGDKLGKARGYIDLTVVCLYPLFYFIQEILVVIELAANQPEIFGPTGWTIAIISMVASISLALVLLLNCFAGSPALRRIAQLFGSLFVLTLVLDLCFDVTGMVIGVGNISLVSLILYASFVSLLFAYLSKEPEVKEEPAPEAEKAPEVEEPQEENQPTEVQAEEDAPKADEKSDEEAPNEEPKEE